MFNGLASLAQRRGRRVVIFAAVFFAVAGAFGGGVASKLAPYGADDPATESVKAGDRLNADGFRQTSVIVLAQGVSPTSPAGQRRIAQLEAQLKRNPAVSTVTSYLETHSPDFVSRGGDTTYIAVSLKPTDDKEQQDAAQAIADNLDGQPGISVGGIALAQEQVNKQVEKDLRMAELLAFPILFLLSLLFFRSGVAALLPLLIGGLAIVSTFLALRIANEVVDVSIFALNLTTGLGLGLAIDYSLFIVSRYREEIAKSGPGAAAMRRTMNTAGRTVLFSSITVAVALASLTVFPQRFLYSMGLGGALVALLASLIALTVLPAVLALLGNRVNALAPAFLQRRAERDATVTESGFWYRLSRFVMRRPIPVATATAALLIVLGIPFYSLKFTSVDAQVLPESASARQVDNVMRAEFPPFHDTPVLAIVEHATPPSLSAVRRQLAGAQGIAEVQPPIQLAGGDAVIQAYQSESYISDQSRNAIKDIRGLPAPDGSTVLVGGAAAHFVDLQSSLASHGPIALAIVIVATLIVLFLMTGSVVLPVKQLVMNALNLSAVFGIMVLVFQDGRLEGLLDYRGQGALEQTMPILLFAVVFGLSTDYGVFLLSRIKEARDNGASDSECVAIGLERTGRIVTAAALLFAIAIGAFATSKIIFIKENGVGTALAVLIDASLIRALLVPSLMELLGRWNWWAPRPLRRLHDRFGLSETSSDQPFAETPIHG
ncbi:MAG: MMPL family transporter [Solirubrobacterales bacterium]